MSKNPFVRTAGTAFEVDPIAVWHHDEQALVIVPETDEFPAEEVGVALRLLPQLGDQAEILRFSDKGDLIRSPLRLASLTTSVSCAMRSDVVGRPEPETKRTSRY